MTPVDELCSHFGVDRELLYPVVYERYRATLAEAQKEGADYFLVSGTRWADEQRGLYVVGRDPQHPGEHAGEAGYPALGLVVTNARPYRSKHNYGIATDSSRDKDTTRRGLQPDNRMEAYEPLARCGTKCGLKSLYYSETFKEGFHLELDTEARGLTLPMLEVEFKRAATPQAGLKRVHALLDSHGPW